MRPILATSLVLAGWFFAGAASLQAARPAASDILPDNTVIYARLTNVNEVKEKFGQTSIGKMMNDPQMQPFVAGVWLAINDSVAQVEDQVGISLDEVLSIPQGEIAFSLVPQESGPLAFVMFIDLGDNPATARKAMETLEELATGDGATLESETYKETKLNIINGRRGPLVYCEQDETLLLSNRTEALEDVIENWDGLRENPLSQSQKFVTIMSNSRGTKDEPPQLFWYADPIEAVREISAGGAGSGYLLAFLPVLGLDGVKAVGGSHIMATEDFDAISHLHVMLERPRTGVLAMIAPQNAETKPEMWVPADVTTYMTVNWDVEKTYNALETLYDSIRGEGKLAEDIDRRINNRLKIDFKADIIDNLDGRFTLVQWYEPPARINSQGTLLAAKVRDAGAARQTMETIVTNFFEGDLGLTIERHEIGTATYWTFIPPDRPLPDDMDEVRRRRIERARRMRPEPTFGVMGEYIFVADRPGLIEQAIRTQATGDRRLSDDLSYKLMLSKLQRQAGERSISAISFYKPEQTLRMWYELAEADSTKEFLGSRAEENQFLGNLKAQMEANPLPPFSVISKYMAPSGGIWINDESGIHYIAFQLKREEGL
ncbi:DUF3352 domain-containing protein [Blastopirellula sp. JC732]|uniref:DUF3352 domain-containing protein n=1 Tax=Blastopirellula sediminis TaxID=2894196 RepID=A0A9X1SEW5_9BACT|nr:DUF3352 domain-containing protein [Blastopirellula sediminis]MCC9608211.1 DUF3352 domain-containing protein [Blastopirellula sediminis]MCC9626996.1 DUF3352 domain-containing protein [Blastopirellula sediminis]